MKIRILTLLIVLLGAPVIAQTETEILKTILTEYYKSEKIVVKGRMQYLFLYCGKANNNEQLFKTIEQNVPKSTANQLKKEVLSDKKDENWSADLERVIRVKPTLKTKVNSCLTLEEFLQEQKQRNTNNQRLMIVSKPLLYNNGKNALVKVEFYRSVEHNSGSVLQLENTNNEWIIKEFLDPWST